MAKGEALTFVSTSAGGYEVRLGERILGHVGKTGDRWSGRMTGGMEIGDHATRREAAEAMVDVDSQ